MNFVEYIMHRRIYDNIVTTKRHAALSVSLCGAERVVEYTGTMGSNTFYL